MALRELIELHNCAGNRALFTSSELFNVELNPAVPDCPVQTYAPSEDLKEALQPVDDRPHDPEVLRQLTDFRLPVPEASTHLELERRDGTLVAVAEQVADGAAIVSDDESLLKWVAGSAEASIIDVRSIPSVSLLGRLHSCGAISAELLTTALDGELSHHEGREVPDWVMEIKLARIRTEINRLAAQAKSETSCDA